MKIQKFIEKILSGYEFVYRKCLKYDKTTDSLKEKTKITY